MLDDGCSASAKLAKWREYLVCRGFGYMHGAVMTSRRTMRSESFVNSEKRIERTDRESSARLYST